MSGSELARWHVLWSASASSTLGFRVEPVPPGRAKLLLSREPGDTSTRSRGSAGASPSRGRRTPKSRLDGPLDRSVSEGNSGEGRIRSPSLTLRVGNVNAIGRFSSAPAREPRDSLSGGEEISAGLPYLRPEYPSRTALLIQAGPCYNPNENARCGVAPGVTRIQISPE